MSRIFVIAGESSGDALGGALLEGLRQLDPGLELRGVGGPLMQAQGLDSRFPMDELSVMGLVEVLPKYAHLKRRIAECAEAVLAWQPDALITIDSPDFGLRVAKLVKAASDIRTIHYVAPTVWAWRPKRAAKMARVIDQVLALFPFEPPLMQAEGMRCDFVGHPVAARMPVSQADAAAFRAANGIDAAAPVLLVLPGSRRGEVSRLLPVFDETLAQLMARHPTLRPVVPAAPQVAEAVQAGVAHWPGHPVVIDPRGRAPAAFEAEKRAAFAAADLALAASGTVSLELAAAETPMVIAYDMNWLSRQMIRRMLLIDTVTLVNIVSQTRVVPEFLGKACRPEPIATALHRLLDSPDARAAQAEAARTTMTLLGAGAEAPGLRAARAVLDGIAPRPEN